MLKYRLVVNGSKQTMNQMIAHVILLLLLCVLPMSKIWHLGSKFDQRFSQYWGAVKPKLQMGPGYLFSWFLWDVISKIYRQFWHSLFKNTLDSSYNFCPIKIMWRKMISSVCLTPVPMATWHLHTWWCLTVPVYSVGLDFTVVPSRRANIVHCQFFDLAHSSNVFLVGGTLTDKLSSCIIICIHVQYLIHTHPDSS